MEKNYSSEDQTSVFEPALSIPHFDEDATLLSARPVVPLDEVRSENRPRRLVVFGLTILAAILVGAISATLLLIQNTETPQSAAEQTSEPIAPSGGSASESAATQVAEQAPEKAPQIKEIPITSDSSVSSVKKRQNTVVLRNVPKPDRAAKPDHENNQINENDNWELRRAERRETRREARRERRRQREQNADDLLRIREIFEGSPRP